MPQIPPTPPPPLNYATPTGRTDLREIAVRQKGIMYCILAEIGIMVAQFAAPPTLKLVLGLAYLGVVITALVFVFMLSMAVYNIGVGIVLGILVLVPLVGLIVLLIVNGKATNILREHGIRVGLMGADVKQIPSPGQIPIR